MKIYVTAGHPGETPSDTTEGLNDAARELRDAIAKKKGLRIVDQERDADVIVEVTDREQRDAGDGGFGGLKVTPLGETIIRFKVKWGDAETEMKGVGEAYWSRAAKDGAERLLKWVARHEPKR